MDEIQKQRNREASLRWYHKNKNDPEWIENRKRQNREASLRWHHKHKNDPERMSSREAKNEYARQWRFVNRDKVNEKRRKQRLKNGEKYRKQGAEWAKANPERKLYTGAKAGAKKRGLEFTIILDDLLPFPKKCPVLGIELRQGIKVNDPNSWSIDRIDNDKGYIPGNVAVISRRANVLKRDATIAELKAIVEWLNNLQN